MINIKRRVENPLITPKDVKPSREDFVVECAFNAAVVKFKEEILMLIRVAERPKLKEGIITIPLLIEKNGKWEIELKDFSKEDPNYDFSDSRVIRALDGTKKVFLTSISHFRLARSKDGVKFEIDEKPFMTADTKYEAFGIEDPRITEIEGKFYINYTAVSELGISTALAVTNDFETIERKGLIFAPENRDVCFFPEKVNGKYMALNRPVPCGFGSPDIWIAESNNMFQWGNFIHILGTTGKGWDGSRLGGGAPMIKTSKGWLQIYHGVDATNRYCLGALLLDLNDPSKIIRKSQEPLLEPKEKYEVEGFYGNVVFTCGALLEEENLKIYYGAADEVMGMAEIKLNDLWKHLEI